MKGALVALALLAPLSPRAEVLTPGSASWIRLDETPWLGTRPVSERFVRFRVRMRAAADADATLQASAMKACQLVLDGRPLLEPGKGSRTVSARLPAGDHELLAAVMDRDGPPLLRVESNIPELSTGKGWEASGDGGKTWFPAGLAEDYPAPELASKFPGSIESLLGLLPALVPVFALVFWLAPRLEKQPEKLRLFFLAVWAAWAVVEIIRLPLGLGFDARAHMDYIAAVGAGRLPLANEGWQMFQPPLYYALAAPLRLLGGETAVRVISWLAGAGLVELSYRAGKLVHPKNPAAQSFCVVFAGALPMSLYMCQHAGNEPLAAFLSAAAFVYALSAPADIALGALFGAAVLAKVTAVLLAPPLLVFLRGRPRRFHLRVAAAAALVCGWWFARNWLNLGRPFVGGWDPARGIEWWQDPGYRTLGSFFAFGTSLTRPVYSAFSGFWDALYSSFWLDGTLSSMITFETRPPWNYRCVAAGALLALPVTALLLAGTARAVFSRKSPGAAKLAAGAVFIHLAAMLALYATVPIYSTVKATYLLGLAPAFALLGAEGLSLLHGRWRRAAWGLLTCWAAASLRAYLAI